MLLAWFAKLNTGALGMTGRDARGHRGAGLKTAATTAKRRGPSCCEGNFASCSEAGDASDGVVGVGAGESVWQLEGIALSG